MRRRRGLKSHLATVLRQQWRWAIVGLASLTVLALMLTVVTFERPTPTTVTVSLLALAILNAAALTGRRIPSVIAAALSGGIIGLCLGIAAL
jgi:4-hydroxybenzoate polyprenyltransferase